MGVTVHCYGELDPDYTGLIFPDLCLEEPELESIMGDQVPQEAGFLKVVDSLVSSSERSELLTLERSPPSSLEHSQLDCWECSQLVCWECSLLDCWECSQLDCWEC